jgi:hypothetical protein
MAAERRAATERVAEAQATAHATAHCRNIEAARVAASAEQRLAEEDQGGLAAVADAHNRRENQYPVPSYPP